MDLLHKLYFLLRNLNEESAWKAVMDTVGQGNIYLLLFAVIFCETGLVILPFLPGDSLLFALGAIAAKESLNINLFFAGGLMMAAAVLGDAVNYWVGYRLGPRVFSRENSKLLNKKHLVRAQEFYDKYGGKTIILARFVPIVRTFAPFVAGVGRMNYLKFFLYNVVGGVAWVLVCLLAGVYFGKFEFVKKHFELVIVAIIVISVLPMAVEILRARKAKSIGSLPANKVESP